MEIFLYVFLALAAPFFFIGIYRDNPTAFIGTLIWLASGSFMSWAIGNNIDLIDQNTISITVFLLLLAFCAYKPDESFVRSAMLESVRLHASLLVFFGWGIPIVFIIYQAASGAIRREGIGSLLIDWMPVSLGIGFFGFAGLIVLEVATAVSLKFHPRAIPRAAMPQVARLIQLGRNTVGNIHSVVFGPGAGSDEKGQGPFAGSSNQSSQSEDEAKRGRKYRSSEDGASHQESENSSNHQSGDDWKDQSSKRKQSTKKYWWEVLDLPQHATWDEIKVRRNDLLRQYHSDLHHNLPPELRKAAHDKTAAINNAFDEAKRSFKMRQTQ